ncbi:MAG TPA: hypothetical protein PLL69_07210 [Gemmatimonadales bacterium]|nr:hypothetical protein [Gemmatimonadales bacterium]
MRRLVPLVAVLLAGVTIPVTGQAGARVEVTVDSARHDPKVRIHNLMEQPRWREALDDAFKISLNWRIELWKRRAIWSSNEKSFEFTIVIRREPLLGQYFITYFTRGRDPQTLSFNSFEEFVLQLERAIPINRMAPVTEGDWFYVADLNVSALDEDQFAEMQRFMGGSSGPDRSGDAISNWLLRRVGLPSQNLPSARTPSFRVP